MEEIERAALDFSFSRLKKKNMGGLPPWTNGFKSQSFGKKIKKTRPWGTYKENISGQYEKFLGR